MQAPHIGACCASPKPTEFLGNGEQVGGGSGEQMSHDPQRVCDATRVLDRAERDLARERRRPERINRARSFIPLLLFVVLMVAAMPIVAYLRGLVAPIPEAGTFGAVTARYYASPLLGWVCGAVAFLTVLLLSGAAVFNASHSSPMAIAACVLLGLAIAAVGDGLVWRAVMPSPAIVVAKDGIDCWSSSFAWLSLRWSDISEIQDYGWSWSSRNAHVKFRLRPAAAAALGHEWRDCWTGGLSASPVPIYQQIHDAWQHRR
jgi:hypothetical protein